LVFVILLCTIVLGAHLYIIESPATYTGGGPISGAVGSVFSDPHLEVSSNISGSTLFVTARNLGSNAISSVSLTLGNTVLPASGFSDPPSATDPVEPESTVGLGYRDSLSGSWSVPSGSLGNLSASYQYLTCYHVPDSADSRGVLGCIMDETYYVPWAVGGQNDGVSYQGFLQGVQCSTSTPNCNLEHPFLAKAMIAAGVAIFGVTGLGWRFFNMIMGTASIALLFVLAYLVSGNKKLAGFSAILLALDTLFFVHSSAALIDVPVVFFSLLGFIFYFWKTSYWKVDHFWISGIFFGLATLSKETAVFLLAGMVTYDVFFGQGGIREGLWTAFRLIAPAVAVFFLGVQIYDSLFTSAAMPYFYQQISYMLSYGASLGSGSCPLCGWTDSTLGTYITPLNWITFYSPVSYLVTSVVVSVGAMSYHYVAVGYYGISNVVVVWMVFAWLPLAVYRAVKNRGVEIHPDDRFAYFSAVWFLWAYVPYIILWLYGRVTYPFYLVTAIPALAAGAAYFITREWFSYKLAIVYVLFAFFLFLLYFPVKDFLPVTLRVLLGK
jgi:hypothetical protein